MSGTAGLAQPARLRVITAVLPAAGIIGLLILFSITSPYFLDVTNLQNLLGDASTLFVCAFGMTLVILVGEIDLSVGAVCSLLTIAFAAALGAGLPWPLASGIVLVLGVLIYAISGAITVAGRIPSFIVTLGAMSVAIGVSYAVTGSIALPIVDNSFFDAVYFATLAGLPLSFYVVLVVFGSILIFQRRTALGREFIAVGINREASRLSGIGASRIRLIAFLAMGLLVGIGSVLAAARLGSGAPNAFPTLTLDVIAAVVIGGASLSGGRAFVSRTLLGCVLIALLNNGLTLTNVDSDFQYIIKGAIILVAVLVDRSSARGDG